MNVISLIDSKTLKKGVSYPVLKVIDKEHGLELFNKKYKIVGDNGVTRNYLAEYFREKEDGGMLNGKFKWVGGDALSRGQVVEFNYGSCYELHLHGIRTLDELEKAFGKFEPYKEYLTISELEEGKQYIDQYGNKFRKTKRGYEAFYDHCDEGWELSLIRLNDATELKLTEVNPNQKRIDELNKLIEETKKDLFDAQEVAENKKMLINSYEAELKELEG